MVLQCSLLSKGIPILTELVHGKKGTLIKKSCYVPGHFLKVFVDRTRTIPVNLKSVLLSLILDCFPYN